MTRSDRIKRRLVRQAVQENLDLIQGRPRAPLRRRRLARWLPALILLLSMGVLASAYALSTQGGAVPAVRWLAGAASEPMAAPNPAPPPLPEPLPADLLATPHPIDPAVFPLAVRRVVLDPGHGGSSLGTRTPQGLMEKDLTLDIALRLEGLLADAGLEVLLTRREDVDVSLGERARFANQAKADLFLSIHVNWIDDGGTRGVETYYLGTTDDPFISALAAAENLESGYTLAEMRRLVDRIYAGVRTEKSQSLAEEIQGALLSSLRKVNPQLANRGVKTAPFLVLVDTEMPAILAEVSCLSNRREAELLSKPLYRQFIAEALARGVRGYAGALDPPAAQKGSS